MTNKSLRLIGLLLLWAMDTTAQTPQAKNEAAARAYIEAYNRQDYAALRSQFSFLVRRVMNKRSMKDMFSYMAAAKGKARIVKMSSPSDKIVSMDLVYDNDTTETEIFKLVYNGKHQINGMITPGNRFIYPKMTDSASMHLSAAAIIYKADSILMAKEAAGVFSGCILLVDRKEALYKGCAGYSNRGMQTKLNDQSMFELASCSKQFTAMAIMILAEQGKLAYSDDIRRYIPDLPYKDITIEHLLWHTSGLPDYMSLMVEKWDTTQFATNHDIVELFKKHKPKRLFEPGKKHQYSNTGYAMLSIIIEKASGLTYAQFLQQNIFTPAGMTRTRIYNTRRSEKEVVDNYAYGYVFDTDRKGYMLPDSLVSYNYVSWMDRITGDGTVNTTISDLLLWDNALTDNKLVSAATLQRAYTRGHLANGDTINVGYGVFLPGNATSEKVIYHTGGWPGYANIILRFPDRQQAVVVLSNNEYDNFARFADKLARLLLNKE